MEGSAKQALPIMLPCTRSGRSSRGVEPAPPPLRVEGACLRLLGGTTCPPGYFVWIPRVEAACLRLQGRNPGKGLWMGGTMGLVSLKGRRRR